MLLIDADVLLYRACRAVEREELFGTDHHVLFSSFEEAKEKFHRLLKDVVDECETFNFGREYLLYVSGRSNWRKNVMVDYKSNRTDRKPLCYGRMKEYLLELGANMAETWEADDLLATDAVAGEGTIVSVDKDFLSVPAPFIRLSADLVPLELHVSTAEQARWFHMKQTLSGDSVDGYKGCPRFGDKTATKWLNDNVASPGEIQADEVEEIWEGVLALFEKAGLDEIDAQTNATVAHILHPDEAPRPWLLDEEAILCGNK